MVSRRLCRLAFHPENTGLSHLPKPSAITDLRVMAVSRLLLDNIPHVKAYWIMLGVGTAQAALSYGADDIDGTVRHELIYHDAGATTPEVLSVEEIRRLIVDAGREPVERDTLYRRGARVARPPTITAVGPMRNTGVHLRSGEGTSDSYPRLNRARSGFRRRPARARLAP